MTLLSYPMQVIPAFLWPPVIYPGPLQ